MSVWITVGHLVDVVRFDADRNADARSKEYVPKYHRGVKGKVGNVNWGPPMDENKRMVELIRRIMKGGLPNRSLKDVNRSLEDVNRSPFTSNIKNARNPPEFKLPTLEVYDGNLDSTMHMMRYNWQMEVLWASEDVMAGCFPLNLMELAAFWFRQL